MTDSEAAPFYRILGVAETASENDIKRAYREIVQEHHPDASDDPDPEHISAAKTARDVLIDEEERRRYDRMGHEKYVTLEVDGTLPDIFQEYGHDTESSQADGRSGSTSAQPTPPGASNQQTTTASKTHTRTTRSWSAQGEVSPQAPGGDQQQAESRSTLYPDSDSIQRNSGAVVRDKFSRTLWIRGIALLLVPLLCGNILGGLRLSISMYFMGVLVGTIVICLPVFGFLGYRQMQRLYLGSDDDNVLTGYRIPYFPLMVLVGLALIGIGVLSGGSHPLSFSHGYIFSLGETELTSPWISLLGVPRFRTAINIALSATLIGGIFFGTLGVGFEISRRAWHQRFIIGEDVNIVVWDIVGVPILVTAVVITIFIGYGEQVPILPAIQTPVLPGEGPTFLGLFMINAVAGLLVWLGQEGLLR